MTQELIMAMPLLGSAAWMLGGFFASGKWIRRFLWPAVAGLLLLVGGVVWWRAGLVTLLLVGANLSGYGDASSWGKRVLVFVGVLVPSLAISLKMWPVVLIGGGLLLAFFWLTRRYDFVTFKLWEFAAGFLQAAALVMATLR